MGADVPNMGVRAWLSAGISIAAAVLAALLAVGLGLWWLAIIPTAGAILAALLAAVGWREWRAQRRKE